MKPFGAWVSVAALFVLGVLLGGLAVHIYYGSQMPPPGAGRPSSERGHRPDHGPGPGPPRGGRASFLDVMQEQLQLSAEQREQLRVIADESRTRAEALREEWQPKMESHLSATREKMEAILTEEQRQKFAEMRRGERKLAERFLLGEGGRGHRRGRFGRGRPEAPPPGDGPE